MADEERVAEPPLAAPALAEPPVHLHVPGEGVDRVEQGRRNDGSSHAGKLSRRGMVGGVKIKIYLGSANAMDSFGKIFWTRCLWLDGCWGGDEKNTGGLC